MFVDMPTDYSRALVRLDSTAAQDELQGQLVMRSVMDIEEAIANWRAVHADPASTDKDRQEASQRIAYRERDFGWQWANVKALLKKFKEKH